MALPTFSNLTNIRLPAGNKMRTLKHYQSDDLRFADVVLICAGGKRVPAHSVLLGSVSGLMRSLLADYTASKAGPAAISAFVYLPDFDAECVKAFLELLYSGQTRHGSRDLHSQVCWSIKKVYLVFQIDHTFDVHQLYLINHIDV
jgi:hypothetical protein